jgi:uncharacterized protein (DUF1697 family)
MVIAPARMRLQKIRNVMRGSRSEPIVYGMPNSKHPVSPWQVALLRGVNVGSGNRVPMSELKAIVEACGYKDARTLLNSGNVVYRAPRVAPVTAARRIRAGVCDRLAVDTPVLVRTRAELERVLQENPLPQQAADHPTKFLVMLFDTGSPDQRQALIEATPFTVETAVVGEHAAYFSMPDGISASKPFELLGRQLGKGVTSRNWNTMCKLLDLMTDV